MTQFSKQRPGTNLVSPLLIFDIERLLMRTNPNIEFLISKQYLITEFPNHEVNDGMGLSFDI